MGASTLVMHPVLSTSKVVDYGPQVQTGVSFGFQCNETTQENWQDQGENQTQDTHGNTKELTYCKTEVFDNRQWKMTFANQTIEKRTLPIQTLDAD
jgi:hypothetical protein